LDGTVPEGTIGGRLTAKGGGRVSWRLRIGTGTGAGHAVVVVVEDAVGDVAVGVLDRG
jgi:hypothetical protein